MRLGTHKRWFSTGSKSSNGEEKSVKLQQSWRVHILTFAVSRTFPYMLTFAARKGRKKKKRENVVLVFFVCLSIANLVAESVDSQSTWMIWADTG